MQSEQTASGAAGQAGAASGVAGQTKTRPAPSRLMLFLRAALPDFLLALAVSVGLIMTVSFGFDSAPVLRGDVLVLCAMTAPLLVLLFMGSWSKRMILVSVVLTVVYAVALVGVLYVSEPAGTPIFVDGGINDVAENYVILGIIVVAVGVLTFLLSRRRLGLFVLLILSVLACGLTQFMFRNWISSEPGLLVSAIIYIGIAALFVFQGYRSALMQAQRALDTHFALAFIYGLGICLVALVVAAFLYLALIAGAGLQTPDIKLFTQYYQRPVIEYTGVYSRQSIDNEDLITDETNEEQQDTNQDAEGGEEDQAPDNASATGGNPFTDMLQQYSSYDVSDWNEAFNAINYQQLVLSALLILIPVLLLILLAIFLQRRRRTTRLQKLQAEEPAYQIWALWAYFEKSFKRLGFERPASLTPMEYALASRKKMAPFAKGTAGVDYLQLTLIYQRVVYDGAQIRPEDLQAFKDFYGAFFKNARAYVGKRRWLWLFWRL